MEVVVNVPLRVVSGMVVVLTFAARGFGQEPPPRYEGSAEAAFVGVSGNASSNTFGLGADSISRPESWVIKNKVSFVRNETSGTTIAQSFLYAPRVERTLSPRTSAFGEYGYFRDRFAGVANRHAATAGVAVKLVSRERQTFMVDFGGGYLNEDRLTGDDVSTGVYTAGTAYTLKLSPTADLTDDLKLLGSASHGDDWRVTHTIALTARLTDGFSLRVSNGLRYAHFPAPGFKKTDAITSVALVAKFVNPAN